MTSHDMTPIAVERSRPGAAEENAAIVRAMYAEFARRDIAAILARLADGVIWAEPDNPWNPAAGTRHGHAGFLEWARVGSASEEILSLDVHQLIAETDTVTVIGHTRCKARITGKTYDTDFVHRRHDPQRPSDAVPRVLRHLRRGRGLPARVTPRQERCECTIRRGITRRI